MSIAGNLVINLMGNTQHLNRALTRSASRIRAFSATSSRSLTSFGTTTAATFAAVGAGAAAAARHVRNMTMMLGGGLVIGTGLSIKKMITFDDAIRAAGARARTSAAGIEILRARAKELGATTSFTATQVAEMMEGLTKGGFKVPQVVGGMTHAVLTLTRAAGTDGSMAARLLGDSLGVFNLKASQSANVASVLAGVLNRTRMDVDDLSDGFKFAAKTGADLGMKFYETIAVMGTLAQAGLRGSLAGTAIRKIGQITVSESAKIRKEFGITFKETKDGTVNVIENFQILSDALQGLSRTDRLSKFFEAFGIRGAQAASSLADNAINTGKLADELKRVFEKGTEATETMENMDKGPGGALRRLKSAYESLELTFAKKIEKPVIASMEAIRKEFLSLTKLLEGDGTPGSGAAGVKTQSDRVIVATSLSDAVMEHGGEFTDRVAAFWKAKIKESLFFPVRTQAELRAEKNKTPRGDFSSGGHKDAVTRTIAQGVWNGLTNAGTKIGKVIPSMPGLPRPGGGLNNVPAGFQPARVMSQAERNDIAERFAKGIPHGFKQAKVKVEAVIPPSRSELIRADNQEWYADRRAEFFGKTNATLNENSEIEAQKNIIGLYDKFKNFDMKKETEQVQSGGPATITRSMSGGQVKANAIEQLAGLISQEQTKMSATGGGRSSQGKKLLDEVKRLRQDVKDGNRPRGGGRPSIILEIALEE